MRYSSCEVLDCDLFDVGVAKLHGLERGIVELVSVRAERPHDGSRVEDRRAEALHRGTHVAGMRAVAALVLDDERVLETLRHERLEELRPVAGVAAAETGEARLVVHAVPVAAFVVRGKRGETGLRRKSVVDALTREEATPVDGLGVVREVPGALDVDAAELLEVHGVDHVRRVDVLPDVVRRVVRLLEVRAVVEDRVHELACREAAGQVAVADGRRRGNPALHRAVLDAQRDAEVLRVLQDGREDLLELLEVLLEPAILRAELLVVADEGSADDVVRVAAEHRRYAHEAEDVVLVRLLEVASDEVVVGADGDAEPRAVARVDDVLRLFGREVLVVEVSGDMVRAVGVTAEDAELEALRTDLEGAPNDAVKVVARERRGHQPDRVVSRLRLRGMRKRLLRNNRGDRGKCRGPLEEFTTIHV